MLGVFNFKGTGLTQFASSNAEIMAVMKKIREKIILSQDKSLRPSGKNRTNNEKSRLSLNDNSEVSDSESSAALDSSEAAS